MAITGVKDTRALTPYFETVPHLQDILDASRKKRFDLEFWASFYPDGLNKKGLVALNQYLNENPKLQCILSGGQGANEEISEAKCMYQYLVSKGIDPHRLYQEDKSTSTRENI